METDCGASGDAQWRLGPEVQEYLCSAAAGVAAGLDFDTGVNTGVNTGGGANERGGVLVSQTRGGAIVHHTSEAAMARLNTGASPYNP